MDGEEDQPLAGIQMGDLHGPADAAGTATCWGSVCCVPVPASLTPYLTLEMCDFTVFPLV